MLKLNEKTEKQENVKIKWKNKIEKKTEKKS